jgi:hypothetical protein
VLIQIIFHKFLIGAINISLLIRGTRLTPIVIAIAIPIVIVIVIAIIINTMIIMNTCSTWAMRFALRRTLSISLFLLVAIPLPLTISTGFGFHLVRLDLHLHPPPLVRRQGPEPLYILCPWIRFRLLSR